jgi:hypothetical protein
MNSPPPDRSPWRLLALVAMAAVVAVAALAAGSALARPPDSLLSARA